MGAEDVISPAAEYFERFVEFRQSDRGKQVADRIKYYRSAFISWGLGPPPVVQRVKWDEAFREQLLAYASAYVPDWDEFEQRVRAVEPSLMEAREDGTSADVSEDEVVRMMEAERVLRDVMIRLAEDDLAAWLAEHGFPPETSPDVGRWAGELRPQYWGIDWKP